MKSHILPTRAPRIAFTGLTIVKRISPLVLGILLNTTPLHGQQTGSSTEANEQNIQMLLQKVEQLEARDAQLEARIAQLEAVNRRDTKLSPSQLPACPSMLTGSETEQQSEPAELPETEPDETLLKIRGYSDISLHGDNQKGDTLRFPSENSTCLLRRTSPIGSSSSPNLSLKPTGQMHSKPNPNASYCNTPTVTI